MANRRFIDFPIATTVGDNDIILIWQSGANKQTTKATFLSGLPENLDELDDVAISGLTNGQILRYDSVSGKWENTDQGNLDLNDLNDVSIVSPSNGQVLVYNSSTSKWENSSGGFVPYTGAVTTVNLGAQTMQAGSFVKQGGTSSQFLKANGSVDSTAYGTGSVTSVALTMPTAFNIAGSPITTAGTLAVTGAGTVGQYIRGDGSLADFPASTGGGSSVSYYLNGSVSQGTIGGVAYKQLNRTPVFGAGTDFTINANGYIASFITDASDPNKLLIPAGNWNFETYFSASSNGGSPSFYVELYKYDGTTFTLIATSSSAPELIAFGTSLNPYYSTLAVPQTTLALTDRLAIRYYVTHSGRTITLHTEDNHLCQIITTFTTGLTALNGLTAQVQNFAVGTTGTDFNIASAVSTHTFNLPTASATNRGALSTSDWSTFNAKQNALTLTTTGSSGAATLVGATLNIPNYGSALSGYLPLTGGTLTGPLAGTSASFNTTNAITLTASDSRIVGGDTTGRLLLANSGTTTYGIFYGSSHATLPNVISFVNNNTPSLTLASSGTATFSSLAGSGTRMVVSDSNGVLSTQTIPLGTVTSVTASSPLFSSGGTTPNITIQQASGSQSGFLSSTDWTTFNNKQNALTNPVTGTGTTNYLPKFTGSTSIGNSIVQDTGTRIDVAGVLRLTPSSTTDIQAYTGSAYSNLFYDAASHNWQTSGGTAKMTLTAGGNLLVGTTSDNGARLQVSGTSTFSGTATFSSSVNVGGVSANTDFRVYRTVAPSVYFSISAPGGTPSTSTLGVNGTDVMSLNASGNVGIAAASPNSRLQVAGSFSLPHTTKSANYTLDATDYTVGFDCASNRTANLPDATTCAGRIYVIYQYNTGTLGSRYVTLDGNGSQTINGFTTVSLQYYYDYSSLMIQSNGSNWIIISDALYPAPV